MLFFGLLAGAVFLYCLWIWPAFQFLRAYRQRIAKDGEDAPRSELQIAGVPVHIYPCPKPSSTTLIIISGLHPNGIYDPRFVAFAKSCTEQGFQVVAPDVADFRKFRIAPETFKTILSVADELPDHLDPATRKRMGVLGISYGAGPAFLIAAKHKMNFVVSIGGYYNLLHTIEYSFSGIHGSDQRNPHEWGRLIFALTHMEELTDGPDAEILRRSLELRLQLKEQEAESLEIELSAAGQSLLQGILKGLTQEQTQLFRDVAKKLSKEAAEISPQTFLGTIDRRTVLYLLHGVSDDSIPYEESIELQQAAEKAGLKSHLLITEGLTHVDVTSPSGVLEFLKMLHWTRLLLREGGSNHR